jgi:hypothetical protein
LTLFLTLLPTLKGHRAAYVLAALIPLAGILLERVVLPVITLYAGLIGLYLLVRVREGRFRLRTDPAHY